MFGYNEKPRPDTVFKGYLVCLLGLVAILMVVIPFGRSMALRQRGEPIMGYVFLINRDPWVIMDTIVVAYTIDDEVFFRTLRERGFRMHEGMELVLYLDPNDLGNVTTGRIARHHVMFLFFGLLGVIGGIDMVCRVLRKRTEAEEDFQ